MAPVQDMSQSQTERFFIAFCMIWGMVLNGSFQVKIHKENLI